MLHHEVRTGTSLVVQWLRLLTPNAGGSGLIPGQLSLLAPRVSSGQQKAGLRRNSPVETPLALGLGPKIQTHREVLQSGPATQFPRRGPRQRQELGELWGSSHLESQPLSGQSSLKAGEKRGGQGWSWQEPRGGRKQETIKEKSIPGRGLAQATGPCRLTSGRHGGGFLGVDAACPTPCLPWQGMGVGGA